MTPPGAAAAAGGAPAWAEPRSGGGVVFHRNCLVVYGGRCRRDAKVAFSDLVEVFSFARCAWAEVASTGATPAPRKCFASAHVGAFLWVFGGLGDKQTYFSDIHCMNLDVAVERAEARWEAQCRVRDGSVLVLLHCSWCSAAVLRRQAIGHGVGETS